jgi:transcription initiation factor TFIIIB Brf1 subunit/transcription initiation factor TFIIB
MAVLYPTEQIEPISDALGVSSEVRRTAHRIADDMQHTNEAVWGRAPSSVAAATIYVAAHIEDSKEPQHAVADAAECSEATIRKLYPVVVEHARGMSGVDCVIEDRNLRINTDSDEHLEDLEDGAGCVEVWEHMSGDGNESGVSDEMDIEKQLEEADVDPEAVIEALEDGEDR